MKIKVHFGSHDRMQNNIKITGIINLQSSSLKVPALAIVTNITSSNILMSATHRMLRMFLKSS